MLRTRRDIEALLPGVCELSEQQATGLVLHLVELATDPIDIDALRLLTRFFTPSDYDDLVEERTVLSKCGYPLCAHTLRDSRGNVRNPRNMTVIEWQHHYCRLPCFQAGQFYREQLSPEPLITRKNVARAPYGTLHYETDVLILNEVWHMAAVSHKTVSETVKDLVRHQGLENRMQELEIDSPGSHETKIIEH